MQKIINSHHNLFVPKVKSTVQNTKIHKWEKKAEDTLQMFNIFAWKIAKTVH